MKNNEKIKALVGGSDYITFPKVFIDISGSYQTASVLNQIIYWSDRTKRKDGFFYKTDKEFAEETKLSVYQVRNSVEKLIGKGFVKSVLKKANGAPTNHYFVDMEAVTLAMHGFIRNCKMDLEETDKSNYKKLQNGNSRNSQNDLEETNKSLTDNYTDNYTDDYNIGRVDETEPKEQIPYKEIINYLNEKTGKAFQSRAASNQKLIKARWNEGYRVDDFKKVVDNMTTNWKGQTFSNGVPAENFLQPSTLFGNKFDKYLNQVPYSNSNSAGVNDDYDYRMEIYGMTQKEIEQMNSNKN